MAVSLVAVTDADLVLLSIYHIHQKMALHRVFEVVQVVMYFNFSIEDNVQGIAYLTLVENGIIFEKVCTSIFETLPDTEVWETSEKNLVKNTERLASIFDIFGVDDCGTTDKN